MKQNKYMIATKVGGIMEQPHITYQNIQEVLATSEKEAIDIYNKNNNCFYFYGACIGVNGVRTMYDEAVLHNSFC